MPTMPYIPSHREKIGIEPQPFSAFVARPVSKKEAASTPAATEALLKEWAKLRAAGCWDEKNVREWKDVAAEALRSGTKAHVGRIFEICVEKGSELPPGSPGRKFKGRVVFQGNNVKDERQDWALFSELSSAPARLQAARACDAYALFSGP